MIPDETPATRTRRILDRRGLRSLDGASPRAIAVLSVFIVPPTERSL